MRFIACFFSLSLLFLSACAGALDVGPGLDVIGGQFREAMRWQDYVGAGRHLQQDVRADFVDQFQAEEDLHVVESRLASIELRPETGSAEAVYQLEFYRLPSTRVKKWQWTQQWQFYRQKSLKSGTWKIVNSPPPLP